MLQIITESKFESVLIIDSGVRFGQGGGWFDVRKCINGFKTIGLITSCFGGDDSEFMTIEHLQIFIENLRPDLIFCPLAQANYELIHDIANAQLSIPVVLWNGTDDQDFEFMKHIAPKVTLYCSSSARMAKRYLTEGAHAIWLPYAADETIFFKDKFHPEYSSDLCYIGVPFGNKTRLLEPLKREYNCLFKWGAKTYLDEVAKIYNSTKIVVQPATHQDLIAPGLAGCSWTTFEAPATGAFLLQRDRPDLHLLYDEDELVTFDGSFLDLKEKIDYFLRHATEREKIAAKAYERTRAEHLYRYRLERVLREL